MMTLTVIRATSDSRTTTRALSSLVHSCFGAYQQRGSEKIEFHLDSRWLTLSWSLVVCNILCIAYVVAYVDGHGFGCFACNRAGRTFKSQPLYACVACVCCYASYLFMWVLYLTLHRTRRLCLDRKLTSVLNMSYTSRLYMTSFYTPMITWI